MNQHLVLKDFDNLLHAFDGLQVGAFLVPLAFVLQLGRRNHLEQHPWQLTAADRSVGNTGGMTRFVFWNRPAANLGPALRVAAQTNMKLAGQAGQNGAVVGGRGVVRNNYPAHKLIAPRVAKCALIGSQKSVSVQKLNGSCGCIHLWTVSRAAGIDYDECALGDAANFSDPFMGSGADPARGFIPKRLGCALHIEEAGVLWPMC